MGLVQYKAFGLLALDSCSLLVFSPSFASFRVLGFLIWLSNGRLESQSVCLYIAQDAWNRKVLRWKCLDKPNRCEYHTNPGPKLYFFFSDYVCRRCELSTSGDTFQHQDYLKDWIPCVDISVRSSLPARDVCRAYALVTGSRFLCIRETLRRRFERLGRLLRYFFKSPSGKL